MKKPYRPRAGGKDGDIIFEKRGFFSSLLPDSWNVGWQPYANAASARNRHVANLNKLVEKLTKELHLWAEAEAVLQADSAYLERYRFDHLKVGMVIRMDKKEIEAMLPYTPETEPKFRKVIYQHIIKAILKEHEADASLVDKRLNKNIDTHKPDVIVTSPEGRRSLTSSDAEEVVVFKASDSGNSQGGGNSKKNTGGKGGQQQQQQQKNSQNKGENQSSKQSEFTTHKL